MFKVTVAFACSRFGTEASKVCSSPEEVLAFLKRPSVALHSDDREEFLKECREDVAAVNLNEGEDPLEVFRGRSTIERQDGDRLRLSFHPRDGFYLDDNDRATLRGWGFQIADNQRQLI